MDQGIVFVIPVSGWNGCIGNKRVRRLIDLGECETCILGRCLEIKGTEGVRTMKKQQYVAAAVGPIIGVLIVVLFISKETNPVPQLIGGVTGIVLVLIPIMILARKKDTD